MITIRIQATMAIMLMVMLTDDPNKSNVLSGNAILAYTYAKIYYLGGGWWAVSGYAADGADTHKVIKAVQKLKAN